MQPGQKWDFEHGSAPGRNLTGTAWAYLDLVAVGNEYPRCPCFSVSDEFSGPSSSSIFITGIGYLVASIALWRSWRRTRFEKRNDARQG